MLRLDISEKRFMSFMSLEFEEFKSNLKSNPTL